MRERRALSYVVVLLLLATARGEQEIVEINKNGGSNDKLSDKLQHKHLLAAGRRLEYVADDDGDVNLKWTEKGSQGLQMESEVLEKKYNGPQYFENEKEFLKHLKSIKGPKKTAGIFVMMGDGTIRALDFNHRVHERKPKDIAKEGQAGHTTLSGDKKGSNNIGVKNLRAAGQYQVLEKTRRGPLKGLMNKVFGKKYAVTIDNGSGHYQPQGNRMRKEIGILASHFQDRWENVQFHSL